MALMQSALFVIDWISGKIDRLKIRGAARVAVQSWWAVLLTQTWALDLLDFVDGFIGDYTLTPLQATVFTFTALWYLADLLQKSSFVQGNKIARALMILVMGGGSAPTYE